MLRRVEGDSPRESSAAIRGLEPGETQAVVATIPDAEFDTSLLPRDHPQWVKDALSVSSRARALVARLKPVVINILTFWDHRVRSALVGDSRVSIDPSGSYRVDS